MRRRTASIAFGAALLAALSLARSAHAEDCMAAAKRDAARQAGKFVRATYWDGAAHCFLGCDAPLTPGGKLIFYLAAGHEHATDDQLGATTGLARDSDAPEEAKRVSSPQGCAMLFFRRFVVPAAQGGPIAPAACAQPAKQVSFAPADVIDRYLHPRGDKAFHATSAAESITTEAVQVLGQIVADRASQGAYALLQGKLLTALKCPADTAAADTAKADTAKADTAKADTATHFPATCRVLGSLRLQDVAMAPAELRVALVQDALAWLVPPVDSAPLPLVPAVPTATLHGPAIAIPATAIAAPVAHRVSSLLPDPYSFLRDGIERRLIPLLTHSAARITGSAAEVEIRNIVDATLRKLEIQGADAYCQLQDQDHVLAAAALGFAWCTSQSGTSECSVMQVVPVFDESCTLGQRLTEPQLSYAESIAGHLLDAYAPRKDATSPDPQGRMVAAADAVFEVACMYASTGDGKLGGYRCSVDETRHGETPIAPTEIVALARDLVLAALDRDGTSLVAIVIRGAQRLLPEAGKRDEVKGIRTLATVAAYAASYSSGASPDEAHKQRTALLESLTRDMTERTERGGDLIFGLGGALRVVAGERIGRSVAGDHPTAIASPVSLSLGFGLDYLFEGSRNGFHVEAGVLDLGQYLSWDEGLKLSSPDLGAALSPSLTLAYAWHREIPIILGATVGYTPSYDFTSTGSKPKGAFNAGLTFGVYVPLFDVN